LKLKELEAAETGRLHLRGVDGALLYKNGSADGNALPIVAVLYGPGTPQGERLVADAQRGIIRAIGGGKVEDDQQAHAELLAGATLDIEGLEVPDGLLRKDFYKSLYLNPKLGYLTRQVEQFQANWANFPPASSPS
jgi:hypothetical protein